MIYSNLTEVGTDVRTLNIAGRWLFGRRDTAVCEGIYLSMVARVAIAQIIAYGFRNGHSLDVMTCFINKRKTHVHVGGPGYPARNIVPEPAMICDDNIAVAAAMEACGIPVSDMMEIRHEDDPILPSWADHVWSFAMWAVHDCDRDLAGAGRFLYIPVSGEHSVVTFDHVFTSQEYMPFYDKAKGADRISFLKFAAGETGSPCFKVDSGTFYMLEAPKRTHERL